MSRFRRIPEKRRIGKEPMANGNRKSRRTAEHTLQLEALTLADRLRGNAGRQAALVVIAGMDMGRTIPLDAEVTVLGRDPSCHGLIRDDGISRRHAEIHREKDGGYVLVDLGSTNGVFVAGERIDRRTLREGDKMLLGRGTVLQFVLQDPIDEQFRRQMYESTVRDGLTGAFNRRHFDERLDAELSFARRHGSPFSLLIFDLDLFKNVNDRWGHPAGDQVLQAVAHLVQDRLRSEDLLARYGGEEFAVIARGTGPLNGLALGERLRREVEALEIVTPDGERIQVTISVGVSSWSDGAATTAADLIALADRNLYQAKHKGRNRVEASADPIEGRAEREGGR
jgi:two-component system cell cycle response regulator